MLETLLLCVVVGISDGDTLKARCGPEDAPQTITVRLAEIDAPEKRQPFGTRSRQHLADVCFQKSAEIRPRTTDRYGRTVARVACEGTDASSEQVRSGMAWSFTRYLTDKRIAQLERDARTAHRGLWTDAEPMPPWEWRRVRREACTSSSCAAATAHGRSNTRRSRVSVKFDSRTPMYRDAVHYSNAISGTACLMG